MYTMSRTGDHLGFLILAYTGDKNILYLHLLVYIIRSRVSLINLSASDYKEGNFTHFPIESSIKIISVLVGGHRGRLKS